MALAEVVGTDEDGNLLVGEVMGDDEMVGARHCGFWGNRM